MPDISEHAGTHFEFPSWALAPTGQCHRRLRDEVRFLHLSIAGLQHIVGVPAIIELLQKLDEGKTSPEDDPVELQRRFVEAKQEAAWVKEEGDRDFPLLHAHSLVAIWGALEVLSEDVAIAWLSNYPAAWRASTVQKLKLPIADYELLEATERPTFVVAELSRAVASGLRTGIGALAALLEVFELAVPLKPNLRRALHEMSQVRNVLVHAGSRVDRRLISECPWIEWKLGELVRIGHPLYAWYQKAARRYTERVQNQIGVALGGQGCTCPGMDEIENRPSRNESGSA